jgi:nicotinate-nucleotide adenylyltransferase
MSVREGFGLDTVVLIPAAIPPHKCSRGIVPAGDRLEMVRLAAADLENTLVSDVELVRSGPSYTIDTVRHFRQQFDADTRLFFIVGCDAFLEIDTWKHFEDLLRSIPMIVLDRPAGHGGPHDSFFETMHTFLKTRISEGYQPDEGGQSFSHTQRRTVYLFPGEMMDVSSTRIRERIGRGERLAGELPPPVEDYIQRKGLYR